jgi:hypothetical protein
MATVTLVLFVGLIVPRVVIHPARAGGVALILTIAGLAYLALAKRWPWLLNLLGGLLYGIGLLAPLTPSEGMPGVFDLLGFVGCPLALLVVSLFKSQTRVGRAISAAEIAGIVELHRPAPLAASAAEVGTRRKTTHVSSHQDAAQLQAAGHGR